MGLFDRIERQVSKGLGAIGSFAGDVFGGAIEAFRQPGRTSIPGIGGSIGGFFGDIGENLLGGFIGGGGGGGGGTFRVPTGISGAPGAQGQLEGFFNPQGAFQAPQVLLPTGIVRPSSVEASPGPIFPTEVSMAGIQNVALPGGALIGPLFRALGGAALGGAAVGGGISALSNLQSGDLPFGGALFRQTACGVRARSLVRVTNPQTGNDVWYRNVGRPILFAGDFATCKRVNRVARRARRSRGR